MPRRQRVTKRRMMTYAEQIELTFGRRFADRSDAFASEEAAREVWEANRGRLLDRALVGRPPDAFWRFEAPPRLRSPVDPTPIAVAPSPPASESFPSEARVALDRARLAWLEEHDALDPADRAWMRRQLEQEAARAA